MRIMQYRPMMEPWEDMDKFMEEYTPGMAKGFIPAIDVYQTKDAVVVETALAGVDPENVNISIENDVLTMEGSMEKKSEVDEKEYYRKEVRSGHFHRAIALPVSVQGDEANADFEDGILKITIPKTEHVKPKTIKVNIKKKGSK
ncbi:MAG: Hsp20/alpha crystallin family protein [Patescibacteria group bacterium]|nr:Hsp20/alpha crystallin family protein [Patescibacteria group bacterium]